MFHRSKEFSFLSLQFHPIRARSLPRGPKPAVHSTKPSPPSQIPQIEYANLLLRQQLLMESVVSVVVEHLEHNSNRWHTRLDQSI